MAPPSDDLPPRPVESIPVEPIPVEPLTDGAEPVPVEALPVDEEPLGRLPTTARAESAYPPPSYPSGSRVGPPSLVGSMGVASIVVAAVCLLGGSICTFAVLGVCAASTMRAAVAASAASAAAKAQATATAPGPAEVVDRYGLAAADRQAVAEGLNRVRPLTPGQVLQLDELLATAGRQVIATGGTVDPAVVAAGVSASGQLNGLGSADQAAGATPNFYLLGNGRLELTDGRAVFFPSDGQPAVRAVAYAVPTPAEGATPPLSDDALRSVLRTVARLNGSRPRSAQVAAVASFVEGSTQQVIVPTTDGSDPAAEVTAAATDENGTLTISTAHTGSSYDLSVTAGGQLSAALTPPVVPFSGPTVSSGAMGAVLLTGGGQAAVAIYLLIVGILTVRQTRHGRLLHGIYVLVKGVAAAAALVAIAQAAKGVVGGNAYWGMMTPTLVGLVYPVVLVFVLGSRPVRDYYAR